MPSGRSVDIHDEVDMRIAEAMDKSGWLYIKDPK